MKEDEKSPQRDSKTHTGEDASELSALYINVNSFFTDKITFLMSFYTSVFGFSLSISFLIALFLNEHAAI